MNLRIVISKKLQAFLQRLENKKLLYILNNLAIDMQHVQELNFDIYKNDVYK